MKNQLSLFVATLATLFITITASAQGEWKWAHYWSSGDGSIGSCYNQITNTAFDEEGNIYVYGRMGGDPNFDGLTFQFVNNGTVLNANELSILLAKFDTLGNMLWYKVVKSSSEMAFPLWMEVRNNNVYISGNCGFYGDLSDDWLYYLDTLVYKHQLNTISEEQQELPFKAYHRWTFFAQFDLEGNLLEDHFVEAYSRNSFFNGTDSIRYDENLCMNEICPVHIGFDGSLYVFTPIRYRGYENEPYTVIVDGDTNRTYNLYFPGNVESPGSINNAVLYKFSNNWDLEFVRFLIDHTDGIASLYPFVNDSITRYYYPHFKGMSFDEEDNMYLTGHIEVYNNEQLNLQHQYPIHIWWDSLRCLTINDVSSLEAANFIFKISTDGHIGWSNQLFTRGTQDPNYGFARAIWRQNILYGNDIIILGGAAYNNDDSALIYFDHDSNPLQRFQDERTDICFFVRYNKGSGEYISHGIVPSAGAVAGMRPAAINNRVFAMSKYQTSGYGYLLSEWRNDGFFIKADTISSNNIINVDKSIGPVINEGGYLVVSFTANSSVNLGNTISANCSSIHPSAVFALYHNPEWTTPFVPDDSVGIDEYYQNREREIYLYPNPTDGRATVCGYMYGYRSIELLDLQGRKLTTLLDSPHGTSLPEIDLSPYPAGTYLVKINFERGVSVVRKVVRM